MCPVTIVDQDDIQLLEEEDIIQDLQERWNLVRRCRTMAPEYKLHVEKE